MNRRNVLIIWLALLFSGMIAIFWRNEWKYSLPTPVPQDYKAVNKGQDVEVLWKLNPTASKPLFLHFFNPDCPCSRFNITHFRSLEKEYNNKVSFAIVVMSKEKYSAKEIQQKFNVTIPVLFDTAIAASCGVYSTPQAVIIDTNHKLYYRGNYNKSRYCTDKKSEYAKMALDALLHQEDIVFDPFALKAYGCQLPKCTK